MRRLICVSEQGNGALDMVLCLPFALFFLFIVTDAGMTFVERGAVVDAVRTGLNAEELLTRGKTLLQMTDSYELVPDQEVIRVLTKQIADEIFLRVDNGRWQMRQEGAANFAVEVSALALCVDALTGELCASQSYEILFTAVKPESLSLPLDQTQFLSREEFLKHRFAEEKNMVPSRFALPLGIVYGADDAQGVGMRYQAQVIALYVDVRSNPSGINQAYGRSVLGRAYQVQEQQLHLVRRQAG